MSEWIVIVEAAGAGGHAAIGDGPWTAAGMSDVDVDEIQLLKMAQNRRRPIVFACS